jgi:hypothetical protein
MKYHIVTNSNGEDTEVKLVNEETFKWIYNEGPLPKAQVEKAEKDWGKGDAEKPLSRWEGSCPDNDRALMCFPDIGKQFCSIGETMKFIKKNNIEIAEESYEGLIY